MVKIRLQNKALGSYIHACSWLNVLDCGLQATIALTCRFPIVVYSVTDLCDLMARAWLAWASLDGMSVSATSHLILPMEINTVELISLLTPGLEEIPIITINTQGNRRCNVGIYGLAVHVNLGWQDYVCN